MPPLETLYETVIWHGLRLSAPAGWEMLQFSRNPFQGRCAFADRRQFRLELNWRQVDGKPDFDRMLSDYSAEIEKQGLPGVRRVQRDDWSGIEAMAANHTLSSRWGRHFAATSMLVELVFLWPAQKDKAIESTVLHSLTNDPTPATQPVPWRAFGMEFTVSPGVPLTGCDVKPAHAEMIFQHAPSRVEERFARRGMVPEWLNTSVSEWLHTWIGRDTTLHSLAPTPSLNGHTIERITASKRISRIPSRVRHIDAAAWICPRDGRLYSVLRKAPSPVPSDAQFTKRLSCCEELRPL